MTVFTRRVKKDLEDFEKSSLNITLIDVDEDLRNIQVAIGGPPSSPYEGGTFILNITLTLMFPLEAPTIRLKTPIWHPNISTEGTVCVSILDIDWHAGITLLQCAEVVQRLLTQPNASSPLNGDAAQLYLQNRDLYDSNAIIWTQVHAGGSQHVPELEAKLEILMGQLGFTKKMALRIAAQSFWEI